MAKGVKTGGRVAGTPNRLTADFKESLNNLLQLASPLMVQWLDRVAETDPAKALDQVGKLAEYVYPKLSRATLEGGDPEKPVNLSARVTFVRPDAN